MIENLSSRHKKTLAAIFENPVPVHIVWTDIENLFKALGAEFSKKAEGSRVKVKLSDVKATFHRPHPNKEADKGAVKSVRDFLLEAGLGL